MERFFKKNIWKNPSRHSWRISEKKIPQKKIEFLGEILGRITGGAHGGTSSGLLGGIPGAIPGATLEGISFVGFSRKFHQEVFFLRIPLLMPDGSLLKNLVGIALGVSIRVSMHMIPVNLSRIPPEISLQFFFKFFQRVLKGFLYIFLLEYRQIIPLGFIQKFLLEFLQYVCIKVLQECLKDYQQMLPEGYQQSFLVDSS